MNLFNADADEIHFKYRISEGETTQLALLFTNETAELASPCT